MDTFSLIVIAAALFFLYQTLPRRPPRAKSSVPHRDTNAEEEYVSFFPRDFIESQYPKGRKEEQKIKDQYIGTFMNAGVLYDQKFLEEQNVPSLREPAAFTPYPVDYVLHVERPEVKPFPTY